MRNTKASQAINLSQAFKAGADMSTREKEILNDIISQTNFVPGKIIWRSSYWGSNQIGAVYYEGTLKNKLAVLKIQGVKPIVSENEMIKQFENQNRSKIIRPPKIFMNLSWNERKGYEALIMEHVTGEKILKSKKLQPRKKINRFFKYYQEYRKHCLPKKPWLPKPKKIDWFKNLQNAFLNSEKIYPHHPFRKTNDRKIALQATRLLVKIYKNTPLEFVHGHFSVEDLILQKNQAILFSNLFWKWKYPFYDAVFAYHWFMYELSHVKKIKPDQIEKQRKFWLTEIFNLSKSKSFPRSKQLIKTALLERAVAGLIIDNFLVDQKKPIAEYLTKSTREQVRKLLGELS